MERLKANKLYDSDQPRKDFLICVDSDGCAMDTMDSKHKKCFGPCLVSEWKLEKWEAEILDRWNEINLYSRLRGINRFKGLTMALTEVNGTYGKIDGLEQLIYWTKQSQELSNQALKKEIEKVKEGNYDTSCLQKALAWSEKLNQRIQSLSADEKRSFPYVKEALDKAHQYADIVVVSSANYDAVLEEWQENDLLDCIDLLLAQDAGTKAFCIGELIKKGYRKENVLMIGDAPGDEEAAGKNGIFFYPILVKQESASWKKLLDSELDLFLKNRFEQKADQLKKQFYGNFL